MGRKIDPAKLVKVKELLARGGLSLAQVAIAAGVSKGLVQMVKNGKHYYQKPRPRTVKPFEVNTAGPLGRCPICGGLVHLPCAACRLRGDQ